MNKKPIISLLATVALTSLAAVHAEETSKQGWIKENGSWYYLLPNGEMKENGWEKIKGSWYYFEDGKMLYSRFLYYKGEKYYLDESGVATWLSGAKLSKAKFIESITPSILKAVKGKGLFPSIAIAQACLETGFGNDSLSPAPIYNLFGIKAAKNTPASRYVEIKTAEYDENGEKYYIIAKFMKFNDYDDACEYYSKLFTGSKWLSEYYADVIAAKTPDEAAKALTGTYATDPNYGKKLLDIIEKYGLRELDKKIYNNGVKP